MSKANKWMAGAIIALALLLAVGGWIEHSLSGTLSETQEALNTTRAQLAILQSKFPLRKFEDAAELNQWLSSQPIDDSDASSVEASFRDALELQSRAADDGFLISAEFFSCICECPHTIHLDGREYTYHTTGEGSGVGVFCIASTQNDGYYFWGVNETQATYFELGNILWEEEQK